MVKRRGKKPPTTISSLRSNNNNNNGNDDDHQQLPAHFTNKQKSWIEKLNSNDPHQREDGCEDIITILSSTLAASASNGEGGSLVDKMLQSLFQSGILVTLVKILVTDAEPQVRVAATAALQNVAAVGGDVAIDAIIGMAVPKNGNGNNEQQPFAFALLEVLGNAFQALSDSVAHLKAYTTYLIKCNEVGGRVNVPADQIVPFPKLHPEVPNKMLVELLGLCCVLSQQQQQQQQNNNNNQNFAAILANSQQLLTSLVKMMIDDGFAASSFPADATSGAATSNSPASFETKYYPFSARENLATSCAELVYVLANASPASTGSVSNFFGNCVPPEIRTKFDALINVNDPAVVEMITKTPSRLCIALYAGGIFVSCFPAQSLRITRLLTLCMKGESIIHVTSQALPLLSAQAVNERHRQEQERLKQLQQNAEQGNDEGQDEEDEEAQHVDDRDVQLRQGPFRSLKVFHTAFTLANEVLSNIVAGEIPLGDDNNGIDQDELDNAQFEDNNNNNNNEDDEANFINSGAFNEFVACGLIPASLSRCGEVIETPSDIVLRSALYDPSSNGHVMTLQANFHATVTAVLSFNAALLMLLPLHTTQSPDPATGLPTYGAQAGMMWASAFGGLNDRVNALGHILSNNNSSRQNANGKNNNNSEDSSSSSNVWSGTNQNIYLQIESLTSMVWTLERKTINAPAVLITPEPAQVDLLRALFFDQRYQDITGDTRVAVTGCMGQIAVAASKHDQIDALQSCTKFLVEMLQGAISKFNSGNNNNDNNNNNNNSSCAVSDAVEAEQRTLALDVAAEAADVLMDAFCDERFDKNVYKPQGVHRALQGFFPLLRPFASTKGMKKKGPRYQHLNGVYQNLGAFMEYKIQNGAV